MSTQRQRDVSDFHHGLVRSPSAKLDGLLVGACPRAQSGYWRPKGRRTHRRPFTSDLVESE